MLFSTLRRRTVRKSMADHLADDDERNFDGWIFWGLIALFIWAPIPLGSNRPWAWGVLEAWSFALLAGWLIMYAAGLVRVPVTFRRAWPVIVLLVFWLLLLALYFTSLPPGVVGFLSPEAARVHGLVHAAGSGNWITLSVDPHASRVAWLKSAAYASCFAVLLLVVNQRRRVEQLAYSLIFTGVALSIYGILMHMGDMTIEYFGTRIVHGENAAATYANRNHFAGYLEMVLAIGTGLLIADLSDKRHDTWKKFFRSLIELVFSSKIRLRLYLSVLVIAIVTTHSRMGNTAFFSSLLVAGVIGLALSRHATRATVVLLTSLIVIDLLIVGSWFGVEKLAKRIEETTLQGVEERQETPQLAQQIVKDYPWFGAGPGSFYTVFPRYRGPGVVTHNVHAHNDYVQFAAEHGIIGFGIIGSVVVLSLGAAVLAQWRRRDLLMRGMAFATVMGVTAILIHSTVDFNLQIPANALLFVLLLALAWIALFLDRRPPSSDLPASAVKGATVV